ncbi:MAG: hypothetical protein TB2022_2940 [Candidatus Phytoplasma citri]|nr:MAG: hypothetical protein TB2022_2940 [Candidatus Phytoplasma aurantifolia]
MKQCLKGILKEPNCYKTDTLDESIEYFQKIIQINMSKLTKLFSNNKKNTSDPNIVSTHKPIKRKK